MTVLCMNLEFDMILGGDRCQDNKADIMPVRDKHQMCKTPRQRAAESS